MGIAEVIAKIQKLRALAESANVHEAATAAALADKLIQEHGLCDAELEAAGGAGGELPAEDPEAFAEFGARMPTWLHQLAARLLEHYGCAAYTQAYRGRKKPVSTTLHVIGRPSDVAAAKYMYGWLSVEIERLAQARKGEGLGRTWLNAFRHGAVEGIAHAIDESKRQAQAKASPAAIMLVDKRREASEAILMAQGELHKRRSAYSIRDEEAFAQGHHEGRALRDREGRKKLQEKDEG